MGRGLADTLNYGGVADLNTKQRWKVWINSEKLEGRNLDIPGHFEDEPRFWDHSLLSQLNAQAKAGGLSSPIFRNLFEVEEDNGENFLSDYFTEQQARNKNFGQDNKTFFCKCPACASYSPSGHSPAANHPELQPNLAIVHNQEQRRPNSILVRKPSENLYSPPILTQPPATTPYRWVDVRWVQAWARTHPLCMAHFPFYCQKKEAILRKLSSGVVVSGRHPHDKECPKRLAAARKCA
jgi:hypothetical protein